MYFRIKVGSWQIELGKRPEGYIIPVVSDIRLLNPEALDEPREVVGK